MFQMFFLKEDLCILYLVFHSFSVALIYTLVFGVDVSLYWSVWWLEVAQIGLKSGYGAEWLGIVGMEG